MAQKNKSIGGNKVIYLKFDENGRKRYQHNLPFDENRGLGKTKEQLEQEGILVDKLPTKLPEQQGKTQELYYIGGQLVWQYEDIIPSSEDLQTEKIIQLETALLEISTLSAIQQAQNEQAIMELTMMLGGM